MPKLKLPRKSTAIDMTAMCDVAFLLLSFFIFTAKFKKAEEVPIVVPAAVTTDKIDTAKKFNVFCEIGKKGEVLVGFDSENDMQALGEQLNTIKNLGLTKEELAVFKKKTSIGAPFDKLKAFLAASAGTTKPEVTGIPVLDSTNNQLKDWIEAVGRVNSFGKNVDPTEFNVFIKADKDTPFDVVDKVMSTWAALGKDQFKMVTMMKDIPVGTEYYRLRQSGEEDYNYSAPTK
jgi:biopolymer transport protein ExbD